MMPAPRRTLAAVISAATLLALAAPAAHARQVTIKDGANDVWVAGGEGQVDVPTEAVVAEADVRRVVVTHGPRAVVVRAKFVDLTRSGAGLNLVVDLRTDKGVRRSVGLFTDNYTYDPEAKEVVQMWKGAVEVTCAVTHKVDYALNTMRVTVPRKCLSGPRWFQVRVHNAWLGPGYEQAYVDNPHDEKSRFNGWSGRVRRG